MTAPPRRDARAKVTGRAQFTGDLRLPSMLHARVVRSTRAHARILSIQASAALQSPGVVDVLTFEDLTGLDPWFGHVVRDRPVLATGVTRFHGEPIAIVVADSPLHARAAADTVNVGYDDLPVVPSSVEARAAAPLHAGPTQPGGISGIRIDADLERNVCHRHARTRGDVDAALAAAALVLDDTYRFPAVYQYSLEPHTVLADCGPDELRVWSSAQHPYAVRRELARIFGRDLAKVRVAVPYVGGGFGSKSWTKVEPLAAVASWKVHRPVRLALDLQEAMHTSRRHHAEVRVTSGFDERGGLLARRVRAVFDTGAYTDNGPQVITSALDSAIAPYAVAAYDLESVALFTNTVPAGSMRSIGAPQVSWACESQLDRAARALGVDPLAVRRRNLARPGQVVFDGLTPVDAVLHDTLDTLEAHLPDEDVAAPPGPWSRGRGVAMAMTGAGASSVTSAWVRLHADGSVSLHCGATEIGQGSHTVLAEIVARALGVEHARVHTVTSDSRSAPYDQSTGASRTTTITGSAVLSAVDDLKAQLREIAAELAGVAADAVVVEDGRVRWGDGSAGLAEVVAHWFGSPAGELIGRGYSGTRVPGSLGATTPAFWEVAGGAAEVRVDVETGAVQVDRYVAVSDVGTALHPPSVTGQEEGAVMMGLGHTLSESLEMVDGIIANPSLAGYRVPTTRDLPAEVVTGHVENHDGPGPFGARGIGEATVVPVAGAVANAIRDALGVELRELPLTPERVWRALRADGSTQPE